MLINILLIILLLKETNSSCVLEYQKFACIDEIGYALCDKAQQKLNTLINYLNTSLNKTEPYVQLGCENAIMCDNDNKYDNSYCQSPKLLHICQTTKNHYEQLLLQNDLWKSNDKFTYDLILCEPSHIESSNSNHLTTMSLLWFLIVHSIY